MHSENLFLRDERTRIQPVYNGTYVHTEEALALGRWDAYWIRSGLMGLMNWIVQLSMRREAERIATWAAKSYPTICLRDSCPLKTIA